MRRASAFLRRFGDDRSGASALVTGLAMIVVLGAAGLGTDVAGWYAARREAQHAADSAAFSAATAMMAGGADYQAQALAIARDYGIRDGEDGVRVKIAPVEGFDGRVEVVIERPARRIFSRFFLVEGRTISARAVAQSGRSGDACVLALHPTADSAARLSGATNVNLNGCSLVANSTSGSALKISGAARLTAAGLRLGGNYEESGAARISVPAEDIHLRQPAIDDPYARLPEFDDFVGCDYPSKVTVSGTGGRNFPNNGVTPEIFCNGLHISGTGPVHFAPGVYVFSGGEFQVSGTARITGDNVTFVLTAGDRSDYATVHFSGTSTFQLSAPRTGDYAGVVFAQSRKAPSGAKNEITGTSSSRIEGAIYFPKQELAFHGAAATGANGCTQIVAGTIEFTGASALAIRCDGVGVRDIGGARTVLVQ